MKKILVFICLMFLSSSAHSMNVRVGGYKEMKEAALGSESVKYLLMGQIDGIHDGLATMLTVIKINMEKYGTKSIMELWCAPGELVLKYENLIDIIDEELELMDRIAKEMGRPVGSLDEMPISFVLRMGLLHTFPCE
ncbi:MAG: hypothetical protein V1257_10595 [Candidatus Neomarinimicrobiota bacterium]|nr:hypothetical protein [Candidatus Neomarinimicrobiota bacterium]